MVSSDQENDDEPYTPRDMRQWAEQEIKDIAKSVELRLRQVTELVSAYSAGELTQEEAIRRYDAYRFRWGDALRGATMNEGVSDERILAQIDKGLCLTREGRELYRRYIGEPPAEGRSR